MSRVDMVALARKGAGFGSKVTVPTDVVPVESAEPEADRQELTAEETIGNRAPTPLDYGVTFYRHRITLLPRPSSIGRILSACKGQPTTVAGAGGDAGSYVHTFDEMAAGKKPEPHSVYLVRNDPDPAIVDLFWDSVLDDYTLTFAPDKYVEMETAWISRALDDTQPAPVAAADSGRRWKPAQVLVYISIAGAAEATVVCRDASVKYGNQHDTDEAVLGSDELYALPPGNIDPQVTFTPREQLSSYYREALKKEPDSIALRVVATGRAIGTTSQFFTYEEKIYACEAISAPAPIDASSVLKGVTVTARPRFDDVSGKLSQTIITNDRASY